MVDRPLSRFAADCLVAYQIVVEVRFVVDRSVLVVEDQYVPVVDDQYLLVVEDRSVLVAVEDCFGVTRF